MTMPRKIPIDFGEAFPCGVFAVSEVTAARDYDRSTREAPVQAVDEESGLLVWTVDVLDADPDARKSTRQFTVKVLAPVQPVPPANPSGFPFTPVEFTGLTATPYVDESGMRAKLAWSFRATGMVAPKTGPKPVPVPESKAS
jgi:hypothetical protein